MATFTIVNVHTADVHLQEFYYTLPLGETLVLDDRSPNELPDLKDTLAAVAAGEVTFAVTYTADEISSGFSQAPNTVGGDDTQEVAAADLLAVPTSVYNEFVAGGGGADDITLYAIDALPFKFRVMRSWLFVDTTAGASTATLRDEAAGAGTVLATFDTGTTGLKESSTTIGELVTPSATKGLFLRRSDDQVDGKLFVLVRREA